MAEEKWVLDTKDGHKIYGVLNRSDTKKNNKAVLHIHGLTGFAYEYASTRMARTFTKYGYDVIRPNLYWWEPKARNLVDCTLKIHAKDIDLIVKHFKKKYKKLYATGHSYGGPSLMESDINQFAAVSLWDPSFTPATTFSRKDFLKLENGLYASLSSSGYLVGEDFINEALSFDRNHALKLSHKCKTPLQVVYGDNDSVWIKYGESFHTHSKGPTSEHAIKETQHCFHEEGSTEKLLRYTRKWFDQF